MFCCSWRFPIVCLWFCIVWCCFAFVLLFVVYYPVGVRCRALCVHSCLVFCAAPLVLAYMFCCFVCSVLLCNVLSLFVSIVLRWWVAFVFELSDAFLAICLLCLGLCTLLLVPCLSCLVFNFVCILRSAFKIKKLTFFCCSSSGF